MAQSDGNVAGATGRAVGGGSMRGRDAAHAELGPWRRGLHHEVGGAVAAGQRGASLAIALLLIKPTRAIRSGAGRCCPGLDWAMRRRVAIGRSVGQQRWRAFWEQLGWLVGVWRRRVAEVTVLFPHGFRRGSGVLVIVLLGQAEEVGEASWTRRLARDKGGSSTAILESGVFDACIFVRL